MEPKRNEDDRRTVGALKNQDYAAPADRPGHPNASMAASAVNQDDEGIPVQEPLWPIPCSLGGLHSHSPVTCLLMGGCGGGHGNG